MRNRDLVTVCPACEGTGQDKDIETGFYTDEPCYLCGGEGVLTEREISIDDM